MPKLDRSGEVLLVHSLHCSSCRRRNDSGGSYLAELSRRQPRHTQFCACSVELSHSHKKDRRRLFKEVLKKEKEREEKRKKKKKKRKKKKRHQGFMEPQDTFIMLVKDAAALQGSASIPLASLKAA